MDIEMLERIVEGLKDEVTELKRIVYSLVPQIPWHEAPSWARYAAMDEDGAWFWYEKEPIIHDYSWIRQAYSQHEHIPSVKSNCPWKNSLHSRP